MKYPVNIWIEVEPAQCDDPTEQVMVTLHSKDRATINGIWPASHEVEAGARLIFNHIRKGL